MIIQQDPVSHVLLSSELTYCFILTTTLFVQNSNISYEIRWFLHIIYWGRHTLGTVGRWTIMCGRFECTLYNPSRYPSQTTASIPIILMIQSHYHLQNSICSSMVPVWIKPIGIYGQWAFWSTESQTPEQAIRSWYSTGYTMLSLLVHFIWFSMGYAPLFCLQMFHPNPNNL